MAFQFTSTNPSMFFGSYEFVPVPLITWNVNLIKDSKDQPLYLEHTLDMQGLLANFASESGAFTELMEKREELIDAVSASGQELRIVHDGVHIVSGVFPTLDSLTFDAGTWTDKIDYSLTFIYNESIQGAPLVENFSESWSFQEADDRRSVTVSHDISAVGINTAGSGTNNALQNARTFVLSKTGYDKVPTNHPAFVQASGLLPSATDVLAYEGLRTENIDVQAGSVQLNETFVLSSGNFTHVQTGQFQTDSQGTTTVTVDGTINGLGRGESAFLNALSAYSSKVSPKIPSQAAGIYSRFLGSGTLYLSRPQSKSISQNEFTGTITYGQSYTDDPGSNLPEDIQDASVQVTNNEPTKAYATIPICERTAGPIVQDIATTRPGTYTINGSVTAKTGVSIDSAVNYAVSLINSNLPTSVNTGYTFQTLILLSKSIAKDVLKRTVNFNVQWQYTSADYASGGTGIQISS